jgi:site-specific DNA-methyltransferase (adenine-specific)
MTKELLGGLELNRIYQRDCLEASDLIESGSVDLILTDLPYGNMNTDGGRKLGIDGWDFALDPAKIFEIANRILRKNGKLILFSQEPYTTELIKNSIPNIPFSQRAIWEKDNFANPLGVNKAMVSFYEDVLIFSKKEDTKPNPAKEYTDKIRKYINKQNKDIFKEFELNGYKKYALLDTFNSDNARRYNFPTKETYDALIKLYEIDKMQGFKEYDEIRSVFVEFERKTPSVFNLWQGKKYKPNIFKYKKDYDGFHPTQKPVLLLEDLIKTFSNEGDLVVDLTCGSGSTCVAATRTGRKFIGFETEPKYVEIANKRLDNEEESND